MSAIHNKQAPGNKINIKTTQKINSIKKGIKNTSNQSMNNILINFMFICLMY
jgi:hypothetical protein